VEWIYNHKISNQEQAQISIFEWIDCWYNRKRRHSALEYKTIDEFNEININFNNAV